MRRPVYLLLDSSGSIRGEPNVAVNTVIRVMASALRLDPHALETMQVSIITFDADLKVVTSLTPLDEFQIPQITTPQSGATQLGLALETLGGRVRQEIRKSSWELKRDCAPFLFVITEGKPSNLQLLEEQCPKLRENRFSFVNGCVAGQNARKDDLASLCKHVVVFHTKDGVGFTSMSKWVTTAISSGNRSMEAIYTVPLPPPRPKLLFV